MSDLTAAYLAFPYVLTLLQPKSFTHELCENGDLNRNLVSLTGLV